MNIYQSKKFAKVWDEHTKKDILRIKMMNKIMERAIGDLKGKIVLDAGCGNGFFIPNLLKKNPKNIIGIDISKWLLEIAREKFQSERVKFYQMDLRKKLDFKNNFFDVIVCYNVLQEIRDISVPIREMARVFYHLFVSGLETRSLSPLEALRRYPKIEPIHSTAIKGFEKFFIVYRKPISYYINEIVKNNLKILEIKDVLIPKSLGKYSPKHKERIGLPVFLLMRLKK